MEARPYQVNLFSGAVVRGALVDVVGDTVTLKNIEIRTIDGKVQRYRRASWGRSQWYAHGVPKGTDPRLKAAPRTYT